LSDALLANVVFFGSEQNKRVYIQLPTSADNVALPVLLLSAVLLAAAATDQYLLRARRSAANPPQQHAAGE